MRSHSNLEYQPHPQSTQPQSLKFLPRRVESIHHLQPPPSSPPTHNPPLIHHHTIPPPPEMAEKRKRSSTVHSRAPPASSSCSSSTPKRQSITPAPQLPPPPPPPPSTQPDAPTSFARDGPLPVLPLCQPNDLQLKDFRSVAERFAPRCGLSRTPALKLTRCAVRCWLSLSCVRNGNGSMETSLRSSGRNR